LWGIEFETMVQAGCSSEHVELDAIRYLREIFSLCASEKLQNEEEGTADDWKVSDVLSNERL